MYVVCPIRLRTEIISQLNGLLLKHKEYSFRLFEHVFASTILANSKFRKLPIPFWFRCEANQGEISLKKTTVNLPLLTKEYETWRDFAISSIFQNLKSSSQMRHEIADSILCLESKVQAMHVDARGIVERRTALVMFLKKFMRKIPFIRSLKDHYHQSNRLTQIEIEKSKKSDLEDLLKNREQNQKRMIISQLYHGLGVWFLKTNLHVRNPNSS